MADKKKKFVANKEPVCHMNVAAIITALHNNAVEKAKPETKGCKIANSAVAEKGDEITSAGEHIISVLPEKEGGEVKKADALSILKTYVQWFVGPDLAKKVTNETVIPLDEAPGTVHESKSFMSFKSFLLKEADGDDPAKPEENPEGEGKPEDRKPEESKPEEGKPEDNKDQKKDDDDENKDGEDTKKQSSSVGYYITYNLNVEGLPHVALKDAMKKFAMTFFDDVTFKAAGIFGGGDSFKVSDVKDALRSVFGPIDPDELAQKIAKQIEDIQHPNTDRPEVKIRDKKTLLGDLGDAVTGKEKQMIDNTEYSVWISLQEYDPKKPLFNKRVIADIVTSSITGLWKKFKNKITRDDVIFIENYADTHEDTKKLKDLQNKIFDATQITKFIETMKTALDVYNKIKENVDAVEKDGQYRNSKLAHAYVEAWTNFKNQVKKNSSDGNEISVFTAIGGKRAKIREVFKPFVDLCQKVHDKYYDKSLDEAISSLNKLVYGIDLKKLVMESLFGEAEDSEESKDDEDIGTKSKGDEKTKKTVNLSKIEKLSKKYIVNNADQPDPKLTKAAARDDILNMCKVLDASSLASQFEEKYKYGVMVDYTGMVESTDSTLKESIQKSLMNEILSIVDEADDDKDSNKEEKSNIDPEKIHKALQEALTTSGVDKNNIGNFITLNMKKLDESYDPHLSYLDEVEQILNEESKIDKYIKDNNLSKEDALKSDYIEKMRNLTKKQKTEDEVRASIEAHFNKKAEAEKKKAEDEKNKSENSSHLPEDKKIKQAYVLPFDAEKEDVNADVGDVKEPDVDVEGKGRKDLYIIPMKDLRYKDKEYNTYATNY